MNKELASICTTENLIKTIQRLGYRLFDRDDKDYNLNVISIRSENQVAGKFDDIECLLWKYNNVWSNVIHSVTTDPSDLCLLNPKNTLGAAIVKPGQYPNSHRLGLHKGKYEALVQQNNICVIRDNNRNNILDTYLDTQEDLVKIVKPNLYGGFITKYLHGIEVKYVEETGKFGINHHRASAYKILEHIGLYSEGCTVHDDPTQYVEFIKIIKEAVDNWGNNFTTTYLTEKQIRNSI